jgi:hypothetical protein
MPAKSRPGLLGLIPAFGGEGQRIAYFAYGSNMSPTRMCRRLGHSDAEVGTFVAWARPQKAKAKGYRRTFTRPVAESLGQEGCANLEPDDQATTEGVLYHLSDSFIRFLDLREEGYRREQVTVEVGGKTLKACAYIANQVREGLKPKKEYLDVLRIGAKQFDLTEAARELHDVETLPDEAPISVPAPPGSLAPGSLPAASSIT